MKAFAQPNRVLKVRDLHYTDRMNGYAATNERLASARGHRVLASSTNRGRLNAQIDARFFWRYGKYERTTGIGG